YIASSPSAPAPSLPHGGGGGGAGLALERIPFQRNGVGGLARRERLGREIVDRHRGGDRVGGGAQLLRLGLGGQPLSPRRLDVADVRRVQAIAQRLRRDREREGALGRASPSSPVPWKMSTVSRSRVADGLRRISAQARVSQSEGPRWLSPSGSTIK